jgi:hypothetical protein
MSRRFKLNLIWIYWFYDRCYGVNLDEFARFVIITLYAPCCHYIKFIFNHFAVYK